MAEDRQATFRTDGTFDRETPPEARGTNDFGEEKGSDETDGGYNRYAVSSLLQKAVRRSDEEVSAWAAWELTRSGYGWHLWDRLNTFVVEDLRAGQSVATTVGRYESLADEWGEQSHRGQLCAVHAALACARARSSREASNAVNYFSAVAEERGGALERGDAPGQTFPVGDLEPGGEYDVAFDGHTGEGTRLGRGAKFFRVHGARVGPEGEDEQSARWQILRMLMDENEYTDADLDHATNPVDPDDPWDESR